MMYEGNQKSIRDKIKYLAFMAQRGEVSGPEAERAINREIEQYAETIGSWSAEERVAEINKLYRTKWRLLIQATNGHGKPIRVKTMEDWIVFWHGDKELCSITVRGNFPGEIRATKELLAYEKGLNPEDITHTIERR